MAIMGMGVKQDDTVTVNEGTIAPFIEEFFKVNF